MLILLSTTLDRRHQRVHRQYIIDKRLFLAGSTATLCTLEEGSGLNSFISIQLDENMYKRTSIKKNLM